MAVPTSEQLNRAGDDLDKLHAQVNGDRNSTVVTDAGTVPSVQKAIADAVDLVGGTAPGLIQVAVRALDAAQQANTDAAAAAAAALAAMSAGGIYVSTAAGISGTVNNQYFSVVDPADTGFLILYRNNAGVAEFQRRYAGANADLYRALAVAGRTAGTVLDATDGALVFELATAMARGMVLGMGAEEVLTIDTLTRRLITSLTVAATVDGALVPDGAAALESLAAPVSIAGPGGSRASVVVGDGARRYFEVDSLIGVPVVELVNAAPSSLAQDGSLYVDGLGRVRATLGGFSEPVNVADPLPVPELTPDGPQVILDTADTDYTTRVFQGIPGIARTGSRLWAAWYANRTLVGTNNGEGPQNYVVLAQSDNGTSWTESAFIAYDGDATRRVFDPQVWAAPDGALWVLYSVATGGEFDGIEGAWVTVCNNPLAARPVFERPWRISPYGIPMLPKRIDGRSLVMVDYWRQVRTPRTPALAGKRLFRLHGAERRAERVGTLPESVQTASFDETYIEQLQDGRIMAAYRTAGSTERVISSDGGRTWGTPATWTALGTNPSARIWMGRSPTSGRLAVAYNNASSRTNLVVKLSDDDGETFPYSVQIDGRTGISYPTVVFDGAGGLHVIYDRNRITDGEIIVAAVSEAAIVAGTAVPTLTVISSI